MWSLGRGELAARRPEPAPAGDGTYPHSPKNRPSSYLFLSLPPSLVPLLPNRTHPKSSHLSVLSTTYLKAALLVALRCSLVAIVSRHYLHVRRISPGNLVSFALMSVILTSTIPIPPPLPLLPLLPFTISGLDLELRFRAWAPPPHGERIPGWRCRCCEDNLLCVFYF